MSSLPPRRRRAVKGRPQVLHLDALPEGVLLYNKAQMAAAFQVSVRCLTGMMARGEVSYLKINGRIVRFHLEAALRRLAETSLVCNGPAPSQQPLRQIGEGGNPKLQTSK